MLFSHRERYRGEKIERGQRKKERGKRVGLRNKVKGERGREEEVDLEPGSREEKKEDERHSHVKINFCNASKQHYPCSRIQYEHS